MRSLACGKEDEVLHQTIAAEGKRYKDRQRRITSSD
jgi:hypothetical protein